MRRINFHRLELKKDREYAEVIFFGDLHLGHPNCLKEEVAQGWIDYAKEHKSYLLLMGDLIESGIIGSVGDSVYTQKLNPQEQMEEVVEFLEPVKELIIGLHSGNHEQRIWKQTGIDISKIMAKMLRVPYLSLACWNILRVGNQTYTVYSLHGASGSRFIYTKLKAATDISHYFDADIVAMGHIHDLASHTIERQSIDKRTRTIAYKKSHILLTGHYLGYNLSYAQAKGMPPSKIGSPKAMFYGDRHDVHFSM